MAFKFVCFAACLAIANAGLIATPVATPLVKAAVAAPVLAKTEVVNDYDPHPQYNYAYDIQDALTGDSKGHQEIRDGDVVQGRYFLNEADGTRRIVEYTADPVNGFNAVVHREPAVAAVAAAPVVAAAPAPVIAARVAAPAPILAQPVAARFATPLTYAAPIATKTIIH